jgi:phage terminase large subunit GpA-like protein
MSIKTALELTLRAAARACHPKQAMTVSEWADACRFLSETSSAEPGRWKTSRTPYLRQIMDHLSEDSPTRIVPFMKSSQSGGTEAGSNWIGYIMAHAKGPCAVVMPTEKSLGDWMSQKFDPMAADTPEVAAVLRGRSNKSSDNNAARKKFTGGILYTKTAGSTAELKSTSLRYAIADEVDEYDWANLQGDPLGLLEVRLTAFHDAKLFVPSSPTMTDASRIEQLFLAGDQRRYHVPCPHCDELQHLKWANLKYTRHPLNPQMASAVWYVCEHCGAEIEERHKASMLPEIGHGGKARWIPGIDTPRPHPSWHINALYSPIGLGRSWAQLAEQWLEAQGQPEKLMVFVNTRLGETFANRANEVKPHALQARAEPYALRTAPPGCLILTSAVDTQDDRLEVQILGHGKGGHTWTIDYTVLEGSPAGAEVWDKLHAYLQQTIPNTSGNQLRIEATAIDSGGHHTHTVYDFVRRSATTLRRCIAIKGSNTPSRQILGKPTAQDVNFRGRIAKRGVMLYMVGTDTAKDLLFARLMHDSDKPPEQRKIHFPESIDTSYYNQLTAETYNPRAKRWELKKGRRNEALDTWIYALAVSHHPELQLHKWSAAQWDKRAVQIETSPANETPAAPAAIPATIPAPSKKPARPARPTSSTDEWSRRL